MGLGASIVLSLIITMEIGLLIAFSVFMSLIRHEVSKSVRDHLSKTLASKEEHKSSNGTKAKKIGFE